MPKVTEEELVALKAKYLTAHSEYDRCVATLAQAGLRSATSLPKTTLNRLAEAFSELQAARRDYREALFEVAFDSNEPST